MIGSLAKGCGHSMSSATPNYGNTGCGESIYGAVKIKSSLLPLKYFFYSKSSNNH